VRSITHRMRNIQEQRPRYATDELSVQLAVDRVMPAQ
jgi:hypothetical protein